MKRIFSITNTILSLVVGSCNLTAKRGNYMKDENKSIKENSINKDTIPKVTELFNWIGLYVTV